ncbi:hypothetical protein D3C84_619300 [compost metagenome]
MVQHGVSRRPAGAPLCVGADLRCIAGDAGLQPVHLPQRARHQLSLLHLLHRLVRLVSAVCERRRRAVLLARQSLVGQRFYALFHWLRRVIRQPVRAQLPADRHPQPLDGSLAAGVGGLRRAGGRAFPDDQLRPGLAPGHDPGADLHGGNLCRGYFCLAAGVAGRALFHHCLVGVSARRHHQYPDGAGLPA